MFLDSVLAGLKVLTYWETYAAGLEYFAIFFIPMAIAGKVMDKAEGAGCVAVFFGALFFQALHVAASVVLVLTLAPIIFGFAEDAAWSFPWKILTVAPGAFFKLVGALVVASILLEFLLGLSIIFRLLINSLRALILGGPTLMFVLGIMELVNPDIAKGPVDFTPGFWFLVGLLVIGGIMSWVGRMVAALIVTGLEMVANGTKGIGQLAMVPIGAIFGFIPVFMYGAWLGAQVKGGFQ